MIFCWDHSRNFKEFIQLLGRCCGHKDYCQDIKMIGPKEMFVKAQQFVRNLLDLKADSYEKYDKNLFKKNKANEGILYERFSKWEDARNKILLIHRKSNPFNMEEKMCVFLLLITGFYHDIRRKLR